MKKKTIFLLASVGLGAALVGATFADWAVTDNADPFSIKVSTGEVHTGDTEYVTLSWGDGTTHLNVQNLQIGQRRVAQVLNLRADSETHNDTLYGTLSYSVDGHTLLKSKLHLDFYETEFESEDFVAESDRVLTEAAIEALEDLDPIVFTSGSYEWEDVPVNSDNIVSVVVYLDDATTPTELKEMADKQVNVTFDWAKGSHNVVEYKTVYATGFSATPYIYAWTTGSSGTSENAPFPGVAMTAVEGRPGYYMGKLDVSYANVLFTTQDEAQKSGDLAMNLFSSASSNLFTYDATKVPAKGEVGTYQELNTPTYYLVGDEFGGWSEEGAGAVAITVTNGSGSVQITTNKADSEFKIKDVANNIWYSEFSTDGGAANFRIGQEGTYTITFYPNMHEGVYIVCAQAN